MNPDFVGRNTEFLQKIKDGEIESDRLDGGFGSFLLCLFDDENHDAIPLFFEFLAWKTGRDYSVESEWVQKCLEKSSESYEEFEEMVMGNPLTTLLMLSMMMSE